MTLIGPPALLLAEESGFDLKNPKNWVEAVVAVFKLVFGDNVPVAVLRIVGYALFAVLLLLATWGLLYVISKITELWRERIWPLFYKEEELRRRELRRRFADHIESNIRRLNSLEQWTDHRFAELEAEVEAEGQKSGFLRLSRFRSRTFVRREHSLSRALQRSGERLIILEGEPGAGKSVALRHVTQIMARHAMRSKRTDAVIPLYLNLKELNRSHATPVDANLIRSFVIEALNRGNDRDIHEFIEKEFDAGLKQGLWFFLFDSFDEIPEILSSVEPDKTTSSYANAIADYLLGMNSCRGIVASRQFRGPAQLGWPRFTILALTRTRRKELVRKATLDISTEKTFLADLENSADEILVMASNPMFLSLLVEHVRDSRTFPQTAHVVFERYIDSRLQRDSAKVSKRYGMPSADLRTAAERIAFLMTADSSLSLTPSRDAIRSALLRSDEDGLASHLDPYCDALEYIKLARSESLTTPGQTKSFTYAHRRFQEYFATCVVLRHPGLVPARDLLTDGRWRETAVVLFQTQTAHDLNALLTEAILMLQAAKSALETHSGPEFVWPYRCLHVLALLQSGLTGRRPEGSGPLGDLVGSILSLVDQRGTVLDRKWALEVAGCAPYATVESLLRRAFESQSRWLNEVAYRQAAHLPRMPADIAYWIRRALVVQAANGSLFREPSAIKAFLSRLDPEFRFPAVQQLLLALPVVEIILVTGLTWFAVGHSYAVVAVVSSFMLMTFVFCLWQYMKAPHPRSFAVMFALRLTMAAIFVETFAQRQVKVPEAPIFLELFRPLLRLFGNVPTWHLAVAIYVALWAPAAILAARNGEFLTVISWPVLPIFAMKEGLMQIRQWRFSVTGFYKKARGPVLAIGLWFVGVYVAKKFSDQIWAWVGVVFYGAILVGMVVLLWSDVVAWCADYQRWRRWRDATGSNLPPVELIRAAASFKTDGFRVRAFRNLRVRGIIAPTTENRTTLLGIIESAKWDARSTDESYRLLEQVSIGLRN